MALNLFIFCSAAKFSNIFIWILYCDALSDPLFIYLSWEENKLFVDLESIYTKFSFLVYSEVENLKTGNLSYFFKVPWNLRWRFWERLIYCQTKSCKDKNACILNELFASYRENGSRNWSGGKPVVNFFACSWPGFNFWHSRWSPECS